MGIGWGTICVIVIDAKNYTIKDVAELRAGFPFRGSIDEVPGGSTMAVQMKDVDPDTGIKWSSVICTELPGRKSPDWLQQGDVLFVSRGTRFHSICLDVPPGQAVCSPHFFHLRIKRGVQALPAFVSWQINQPPFQQQLQQSAEGSSQLSIRRPVMESLTIRLPTLADQRRIVSVVELALRERQVLMQIIQNRNLQLQALSEKLFKASATPA